MVYLPEPPLIIALLLVDGTHPEIHRIRGRINEQGSRQGSCQSIRGGEREIHDAYSGEIQETVWESGGSYQGEKAITIYRVPTEMYSCDREAYEPKAVCIGPFFWGRRHQPPLEYMEFRKELFVDDLMSKHYLPKELLRQKCLTKMEELEVRVRSSYSVAFPSLTSDKFTGMLMLDGCFLLRLLLMHDVSSEKAGADDGNARKVVGGRRNWNLVKHDLLLFQNQIPFFVIQSLYELLKRDDRKIDLVQYAINLFGTLDPCRKPEQPEFYIPPDREVHHLLHLIYLSLLPCPRHPESSPRPNSPVWIHSATKLRGVGIKFEKRENTGGFLSFMDIRFYRRLLDAVIEIPQLKLDNCTVSLFRNLTAFEQCYPDTRCYITFYADFMKSLIQTENDMTLLNKILINRTNVDKYATHFFSHLCSELRYEHDKNYLEGLFSDVNAYYDSQWHKYRAQIIDKIVENPWKIISGIIRCFCH